MFLFVDSAAFGCNLALADTKKIYAMHHEPITRGHAEVMADAFLGLLSKADKMPRDIDEIITTVGPGSFTGLRVGVTFAQMTGYSLSKPVHGITSFQAFSCALTESKHRAIILDTKRDDYYIQLFDKDHHPLNEPACLSGAEILNLIKDKDLIVTGDAAEKLAQEMNLSNFTVILQQSIDLELVLKALQRDQLDYVEAEAFYIRDADVSQPKAKTV